MSPILSQEVLTVEGIVKETATNLVLPGVSIIEKGSLNGTATNENGNFSITIPLGATLNVSFIGFETQQIVIINSDFQNIVLNPQREELDEFVIVGYGKVKKSDLTGSVSSLNSEVIQKANVVRVDQALQGKLAGVQVQNLSGAPNSEVSIRIRGLNSIDGDTEPLIIIDGFQGGSLKTLSPNDIESIEVLKDASATAIYGSRGSNGVILVTTKKGDEEKTTITYDNLITIGQVRKKIGYLTALEYIEAVNEKRDAVGGTRPFTDEDFGFFEQNGGTNWEDEIFRTSLLQNHHLSVAGGNKMVSYNISGTYTTNEGVLKNTSYKFFTFRPNVSISVNEKLSFDFRPLITLEEDHPLPTSGVTSPVYAASVFAPVKSVYDSVGNYSQPGGGYGPTDIYNPLALALEPIQDNIKNTLSINVSGKYEIIDGLSVKSFFGYRIIDGEEKSFDNGVPNNGVNRASIYHFKTKVVQNTNQISYSKSFDKKHNLNVDLVQEYQSEAFQDSWIGAENFSTNSVTYNNLALAENIITPSSSEYTKELLSFLGRINYSFESKYLFTFSTRVDGASVFGKNNKYAVFPSVAIGWNALEEGFLSNLTNTLNQLKFRFSYGEVGNQSIAPYKSIPSLESSVRYSLDGTTFSNGVSATSEVANPDLRWETTSQFDVGVDAQLFDGKYEFTVDYYQKHTKDLLLKVPLPAVSGGESTTANVGEVQNRGIEVAISATPVARKVIWKTGITYSKNINEVKKLNGFQDEIVVENEYFSSFANLLALKKGKPIGLFKGYKKIGIWQEDEVEQAALYGAIPGSPKYLDVINKDTDGDGTISDDEILINDDDIVIIGNSQPDFIFGFTNSFEAYNFDLNIFIQGVIGNDIYNLGRVRTELNDPTHRNILDRWRTPIFITDEIRQANASTSVPSFSGFASNGQRLSDRWLEDGSYIRLQSISLGYTLPETIIEKQKVFKYVRLFFTGSNLLTITNYSGYDPEVSTEANGKQTGVDFGTYPTQKSFGGGIVLKF